MQVADAMAGAAPYREQLLERGVLVVPLPIFEGAAAVVAPDLAGNGAAASSSGGGEGSKEDELR